MACLILIILFGVYKDLKSYKISNTIIIIGIPLGLAYQIYEYGWKGIVSGILGCLLPILILSILFVFKVLGAGDIKLFSVIGSFYGPSFVYGSILIAFLLGGVMSLIYLLKSKQLVYRLQYLANYIQTYSSKLKALEDKVKKQVVIPYYDIQKEGYGGTIHFSLAILGAVIIQILKGLGYIHWN